MAKIVNDSSSKQDNRMKIDCIIACMQAVYLQFTSCIARAHVLNIRRRIMTIPCKYRSLIRVAFRYRSF